MIPSRHTKIGTLFFSLYSRNRLNSCFRNVRFLGDFVDHGKPVLLISNHFCWWDGFIQLYLNNRFFHRKFHIMMLEEQLQRYPILNKGGAFSVRKGKKEVLASLQYCLEVLNHSNNMLVFFPQGQIQSLYTFPYRFEKGLEYILRKSPQPLHLVFNVNLVDYFSHKKPELSIYFQEFFIDDPISLETIERSFNDYAHLCRQNQKEA